MDLKQWEAFLDALNKDRYDTATRCVFADWLEEHGLDDEALEQRRRATPEWVEADRWLHDFAAQAGYTGDIGEQSEYYGHGPSRKITYDMVIQAGRDYAETEDYFVQMGSETARTLIARGNNAELYWKYWSVVTGEKVPDMKDALERTAPFSCSC